MSSTYTDKNNPFSRCTKRHSPFGTFSQPCFNKIFSNCLSHNSPSKGWPYRFRSRGTTGSSIRDHDFGHLLRGRRIQMSGHSDLGIFNNCGGSSIFTLRKSRYCVSCLSCASGQSGYDIHELCGRHLWCWCSLFCKYCIRSRIIFHIVTSEYNSSSIFLVLCLQFGILQMTDVHQWGKMNFCALRPCFIDYLLFTSDVRQVPRPNLFQFLPFFIHCCLCCGNLHGLRHRNKLVYQIIMLQWIVSLFLRYGPHDIAAEFLKIHANLNLESLVLLQVSSCLLFFNQGVVF